MKKLIAVIFLTALTQNIFAYANLPPNGKTGAPPTNQTCFNGCHSSFAVNSGNGSFVISGVPQNYTPNTTYPLQIILQDPGQQRWGFEMIALNQNQQPTGTWQNFNTTQLATSSEHLKHKNAGTFNGTQNGPVTWTCDWLAPNTTNQTITFYLAGVAANGNGNNSGDYVYTTTATTTFLQNQNPQNFLLLTPTFNQTVVSPINFSWQTAADTDPVTYTLEISLTNNFSTTDFSTTLSDTFYTLDNPILQNDTDYFWRVNASDGSLSTLGKDLTGTFDYSIFHTLAVKIGENPNKLKTFQLSQNFPNPFNPSTKITYELSNKQQAKLLIFNLLGEKVMEFSLAKAKGEVVWNGTDFSGKTVSSGTYFYRLETENELSETKKMILLK